tara:strand:+ start:1501 stop:2187 length:687 start_codon:yes stop_codon:yes gene_type:complete
MFKIIFQILILIYIIFVIYNIINIQKYNINGYIIDTDDYNILTKNIIKLNPVLFTIENNFTIENFISSKPDYLLQGDKPLKFFPYLDDIYLFRNKDIFEELEIEKNILFDTNKLPNSEFNLPNENTLTILKGNQTIPLTIASNNFNIIGNIHGDSTIYLFNPKHKEEILDKENNKIKKWGHKKKLKKNNILLIPPYWYYIQETNTETIQYHIDINNIFTFIPNKIRNM